MYNKSESQNICDNCEHKGVCKNSETYESVLDNIASYDFQTVYSFLEIKCKNFLKIENKRSEGEFKWVISMNLKIKNQK